MGRKKSSGSHQQSLKPAAADLDDTAEARSSGSLDEDLLDYLQNIQEDSQEEQEDAGDAQPQPTTTGAPDAPSAQHDRPMQQQQQRELDLDYPDDLDSGWRPGLGYQTRHGFSSGAAAAQFAGMSLEHALEGQLADDMRQGGGSDEAADSDNSSSSGDSDDDSDSSGGSGSSGFDEAELAELLASSSIDPSEPVVLGASGRPIQRWHELSLQQRFPVQARRDVQLAASSPAAAAAGGGGVLSISRRQQKPSSGSGSGSSREALVSSISTSMLLSSLPGPVPQFLAADITATVSAAAAAAANEARQHVARYAELAQQLQQAKHNKNKRPGQQGKGVKKQLKKAKVAAKRTAREARSDAGALQLLAAVEAFAGSRQDMQVLPPAGSRQKEGFARQLARLFGVSASSRGGGSSGRTCLVLEATPDMSATLDSDALTQLSSLLQAELAKELSAATISRSDTLARIKQEQKEQRRSKQQQQLGVQRQGSRGLSTPPPDYQRPVQFVSAGVLNPNSSTTADAEPGSTAAAAAAGGAPAAAAEEPPGRAGAAAAAAQETVTAHAAGTVGPSHAAVGAFLESLLRDEAAGDAVAGDAAGGSSSEEEDLDRPQGLGFRPAAAAAAAGDAAGGSSSEEEDLDRPRGLGFRPAAAAAGGAGGSSSEDEDLNRPQGLGFRPAGAAAAGAGGSSSEEDLDMPRGLGFTPAAAGDAAAPAVTFAPSWCEDRRPQRTAYNLGSRAPAFVSGGTADDDLRKPRWPHTAAGQPAAAATAAGGAAAAAAAAAAVSGQSAGRDEPPLYERVSAGLGFSQGAVGLGFRDPPVNAEAAAEGLAADTAQEQEEVEEGWHQAPSSRNRGSGRGGGSSVGADRLAQLEASFKSLQVPGGVAGTELQSQAAAEGVVRSSSGQQRKQGRQQQRAAYGSSGSGLEALAAAAGPTGEVTLSVNMTLEQSKKAKKKQAKQQRKQQRRGEPGNTAAAAAGGGGGTGSGNGSSPAAAAAAGGAAAGVQGVGVGFAAFEAHTTGIGSRLMARWGWAEGEGLGRARQGMSQPVQASMRPKQLGLGYE